MFQSFEKESFLKHCRSNFLIELREKLRRFTNGESGGNNCARTRTADVVEVVAEPKVFSLPTLFPEQFFHFDQDLKRQDATNPAAVEREKLSWLLSAVSSFQVTPKRHRSSVKLNC